MNVQPKNCPCKECVPPKRHYGCHGSCEPYTEWAKNRREAVDALRKEADTAADIRKLHAGAVRKVMRGGGKKWTNS